MVIQDGFDSWGEVDSVAVLDEREGGWLLAEYTDVETGSAKFSGRPDVRLGCYAEGNDHINAFGLPPSRLVGMAYARLSRAGGVARGRRPARCVLTSWDGRRQEMDIVQA